MSLTVTRVLKRTMLHIEDYFRVHCGSSLISGARLIRAALRQDAAARVAAASSFLCGSNGLAFRRQIAQMARAASDRLAATGTPQTDAVVLHRSIVLKAPMSDRERGVLCVSFEPELQKLVEFVRFDKLEEQYQIIFLPTWQPVYSKPLFLLAARAKRPFALMPANSGEYDDHYLVEDLGEHCIVLPFQASSWVAASAFPAAARKDIDILMVANFSKYKRHWRLFEGLAQANQPQWKVVLAGRSWSGRTQQDLLAEAALFGVEKQIDIREDQSNEQIADLLARARLFVAMSHKEGSFIAVTEALMAGTPVALFDNARIGSKVFVNRHTGLYLDANRSLGPQLRRSLDQADKLDPAFWARANASAEVNSVRLNELLKQQAIKRGEDWTRDLPGFNCRNFDFQYADASVATELVPAYRQLREMGVTVAGF